MSASRLRSGCHVMHLITMIITMPATGTIVRESSLVSYIQVDTIECERQRCAGRQQRAGSVAALRRAARRAYCTAGASRDLAAPPRATGSHCNSIIMMTP